MAYPLYLIVRPTPSEEDIPALRSFLEESFPRKENLPYLDALYGSPHHAAPSCVVADRLGALSLLPLLLSAAGIPSASLILRRDEHQRPFCESSEGAPVFDFNLSHASAHVACALMVGAGKIGMDIEEPIPPKRALPLIRRFCSEGEKALLDSVPSGDELAADLFTSMWVEREALAKQDGRGMPLRFDTTRIPDGVMIWTGYLPDTETKIALCGPMKNAPKSPRMHPESLPVILT